MAQQRPEVYIGDMVSELTALDENDLLSPRLLQRIVQMAVRAMQEQLAHDRRIAQERIVNRGARDTINQA